MFPTPKDAPGPLFQYDSLSPDARTFRLLRLLPTLDPSTIECELTTVDLNDERKGQYYALSYEWGPDEPPYSWIRVNGEYLSVRQNLHSFLQNENTNSCFGLHLWIDAVSINQQNWSERGHQVKLMGDIYSCAKTVLVWLGPYKESMDRELMRAFGNLRRLKRYSTGSDQPEDYENVAFGSMLRKKYGRSHVYEEATPVPPGKLLLALRDICTRNYWTRMWIIQEILLANQACLMIGDHIFPWDMIERLFDETQFWMGSHMEGVTAPHLRALCNKIDTEAATTTICGALGRFDNSQCYDFRDKVYALLGLVPGGQWFPVDYTVVTEELFCSVILASYTTTSRHAGSPNDTEPVSEILQCPPASFHLEKVDWLALENTKRVARAIDVSYVALERYLATKPELGTDTLITIDVSSCTVTRLDNNVTEHRFTLVYGDVQYSRINIMLWSDHKVEADDREQYNCRVEFYNGKHSDTLFPKVSAFSEEATFQGCWVAEKHSLKLPLRIFIFLVSTLHKIESLTLDDLEVIEANNGYMTTTNDLWKKTIILELDSIPLDRPKSTDFSSDKNWEKSGF